MKLDVKALTLASAATGALIYALGAIVDRISTWGGAAILSYVFRVDVVQQSRPLTVDSFIIGILAFGVLFALIGFTVGRGYNFLTAHARVATSPGAAAEVAGRAS